MNERNHFIFEKNKKLKEKKIKKLKIIIYKKIVMINTYAINLLKQFIKRKMLAKFDRNNLFFLQWIKVKYLRFLNFVK